MTADIEATRYGGWAPDRHGWFLGLTGAAWIAIAAGGAPILFEISAHRWILLLAWLPIWAGIVAAVALPIAGRPASRWLKDAAARNIGSLMGWSAWQALAATGRSDDLDIADLPGVLSGIRVHDGPPTGPQLTRPAIIADARERTWTIVARLRHPGIGLAEAATRNLMGQGLADLLDGAAASELVSVLALQVRTIPDDGAHRADWQQRNIRSDAPPLALAAMRELSATLSGSGVRHEAFLTAVVPDHRLARHAGEAGGGVDGRARVLYGLMNELEPRLLGPLGCSEVDWLDTPALAAVIRTGFAPGDSAALTEDALAGATGLPLALAGPSEAPPPPRRWYTHDAWSSATCTLALPDKGAVMGALARVLTPTDAGERRSMTVFFEPLTRRAAERVLGSDSMSAQLGAEVRRRSGFQTRASHRHDAARTDSQDAQLARGSALVRVAIAASVTVPSTRPIADYGRRLESSITASGFRPLRLDLAQDSGFVAACIPLGIGLPQRRSAR